jgi:hypothetical protein
MDMLQYGRVVGFFKMCFYGTEYRYFYEINEI